MGSEGQHIAAELNSGSEDGNVRYVHLQVQHLGSRSGMRSCAKRRRRMVHGWGGQKWTGWRPQDDKQEEKFKKMVLQKGDGESVKSLATIQENDKSSAREIAHTTQEDRGGYKKKVLLNVNVGEATASQMLVSNGKKCSGVRKIGLGETPRQVQSHAGEKENQKKTTERRTIDGNSTENSEDRKKSCRGTVRASPWIRKGLKSSRGSESRDVGN